MSTNEKNITFEHPLNERTRTLLRLEHLYQQADYHINRESIWDSRATIEAITSMSTMFSRADLKGELMKELERNRTKLTKLSKTPGIDNEQLSSIQTRLQKISKALKTNKGQLGEEIRGNIFLRTIIQRNSIPGGNCAFDLPIYHHWLKQPLESRRNQLQYWLDSTATIKLAIDFLLYLIRSSSNKESFQAKSGFFQHTLDLNQPNVQLLQIHLSPESPVFPEISGSKHRFTIRFMESINLAKSNQTRHDVDFDLTSCVF